VHRIGRTGRAGKRGIALSFAAGKDIFRLRNIERFAKMKIPRRAVPTLDQVEASQHSVMLDKVRETLAAGDLDRYRALADSLLEDGTTASDVAAALLKMALPQAPSREAEPKDPFRTDGRASYGAVRAFDDEGRDPEGRKPWKKRPKPGVKEEPDFQGSGDFATLFLNIGSLKGARPKDILGALAGETGLPGRAFGAISVHAKHTLAEVPAERVDDIIAVFSQARIKGVPVKARRAV
jgi:ATP-dependent RNA helicase DeaD